MREAEALSGSSMDVRIVSAHTVQAWLPAGFFVLRIAEREDQIVAAAATCATATENCVWLASEEGFLRRAKLASAPGLEPVRLHKDFLSSLFEAETFPNSDLAALVDVGCVHSISSVADPDSSGDGDSSCHCVIEVFGEKGYARIGTHDGRVKDSLRWESAGTAVAFSIALRRGRLRDAIVQRGFSSSALLTVSAAGLFRAVPGFCFRDVRLRPSWKEGEHDLVNICQTPVFFAVDPARNFVVFLGRLRSGVVLCSDKNKRLAVSRFVLKGDSKFLKRHSVVLSETEENRIVLEERSSGHRTSFEYNVDAGRIEIQLDCDARLFSVEGEKRSQNQSVTLRSLLRGIEELGERERCFGADSNKAEDFISSYNSALLFVMDWKEKTGHVRSMLIDSCSVRVHARNIGTVSSLALLETLIGKRVFIVVSFKNNTGIALGKGWMMRLKLWKESVGGNQEQQSGKAPERIPASIASDVVRVMTCPVQGVAPKETKTYSFPYDMDSHSPVSLSVGLSFHHPSAAASTENPIDVEVSLRDKLTLDILDFSRPSDDKDALDTSHESLADAQLVRLFDASAVEKQLGYPSVSRLEIPLGPGDAQKLFGLEGPSTVLRSFLGACYTVSISSVTVQSGEAGTENLAVRSVTLRGVPHVIPFVRAALLRRVLVAAGQNPSLLREIVVRGKHNIERWKRSMVEAADNCLPSFRRAESSLVEALRLFEEIERGSIEYFSNGHERDSILAALQTAKGSYAMWRRQTERMWTPKGVVNVKE